MEERFGRSGEFGRVALGIATGAFAPGTILGGLILAAVLVLGNRVLSELHQGATAFAFTELVVSVACAWCAVSVLHAGRKGAAERIAGDAVTVAGRFMLLCLLWASPFLIAGLNPGVIASTLNGMNAGTPGGTAGAAIAFMILGSAIAMPLFLLGAASAERLRDLFEPSAWRVLLEERDRDLASIYLLPLGVLAILALVCAPILIGVAAREPKAARILIWPCVLVAASIAMIVLGRLCGGFARSARTAEVQTFTASPERAGGAPLPSMPGPLETDARIEAAWTLFDQEPDEAVRNLEALWTEQPASPHAAQALCLMLFAAGREDESVEVARHAIPLCLDLGQIPRASEIFRALCEKLPELDAKREDLVAIGMHLSRSGDLREAANVLVAVLREDPEEARAIKGLLQLADRNLRPGGLPEDAAAIYRFLLDECPESPLADDMRRGLAEAERCLTQITR